MKIYESYHGTNNECANNIQANGIQIDIPTMANESGKKHKKKIPGSFGYGFYTFVNDKELASDFAVRINTECNSVTLKIISEIDENRLLSFLDLDDRENYHAFYEQAHKSAMLHLKRFGTHLDTEVQHVLEGIIIEMFLQKLFTKEKIRVIAVLGESYTPRKKGKYLYSNIPNGQELCIRDKSIIKSCNKAN
ncbi:MAG: hypothetical protein RR812_06560 [Vagococcus sp.]